MRLILRWLLRILTGSAALAAIAISVGWYLVAGSLPDYDAALEFEGLDGSVEIVRDANAVPHIRAETEADTFFALGLVHAQDRLWQMEIARRNAQGRLSTLFGERTVPLDRLSKTLDIYGYAQRAVEYQTPETRAALESYAAGVNAWIRHVNQEALGRGAPEFYLYGDGLTPWVPADSIAILKMMALRLSGGASNEVRRARLQLALGAERLRDILPDYPAPASTTPERASMRDHGWRFAEAGPEPAADPLLAALGPAPWEGFAGASNAWAVDASRSAARRPLLANDPHLWLSAPSVWYLADLEAPSLSAIGGTLVGTPVVLVGHNGRLGWGLTTANVDDQDIFIEQLNPDAPDEYRTPEGWERFETRRIRIDVADGPPVIEEVRTTRHGPVLAPDQFQVGRVTPEGHVAALSWTALRDEDRGMSALMALMRAGSVDSAVDAASMALAPAQMVTLADRNGVAMVVAGAIPNRNPASPAQGRIPAPGWRAENDWLGLRPPLLNPRVIRPPEGAVANANNRITDAPYPGHIAFDWAAPYRIQRIEKELAARRFHSRDSFVALQGDTVSEMARSVLPLIAREHWWREGEGRKAGLRGEALALLADWTGDMDQHSPEPLIFMEWMRQLTWRLAGDELGQLFPLIEGPRPLFVERVFRDIEGAGIWCDVDKTPEPESCAEMASRALDDALERLSRDYGAELAGWRWGEAHVAVHRHTPFGYAGALGAFFNIEHETSGGNHTLMRGLSSGRGETPFRNIHASGLRVVLDFADLDRSLMMIATGQSGHPFSRWYDHLAEAWARGEMIPMSRSPEDARAGAAGIMRLRPVPGGQGG